MRAPAPRANRPDVLHGIAVMASPGPMAWRAQLRDLSRHAPCPQPQSSPGWRSQWFRFGDAALELVSDDAQLHADFNAFYGDCADPDPGSAGTRLRCVASGLEGSPLLALHFEGGEFLDPLEIALSQYRFLRRPPFIESSGPGDGWRALVHTNAPDRLLITSNGRTAFVNCEGAPSEFVLDCIVGVAQSAQSGVMFLHGASVGIDGAGALLLGASQAGKSTNALVLAMRGHAFLGDDVAAIRLASGSLLPFRKSAGLRSGPLADLLDDRLQACAHVLAPARNGVLRTVVRASALFPGACSPALPLRYAFVMDGTRGAGRLTPFTPGHQDLMRLRDIVITDTAPTWGLSPGRDLLQLLAVVKLLSGLQCFLVERGTMLGTAELIENAMRAPARGVNFAGGNAPAA